MTTDNYSLRCRKVSRRLSGHFRNTHSNLSKGTTNDKFDETIPKYVANDMPDEDTSSSTALDKPWPISARKCTEPSKIWQQIQLTFIFTEPACKRILWSLE